MAHLKRDNRGTNQISQSELLQQPININELKNIQYALDASSIVAITDRKGTIIYANHKFCELSKYPLDELLGQTHSKVNSGYHPKDFFAGMWRTISKGEIWEGDIQNKAKDGTLYWVSTVIVPLKDQDGMIYQYVSIRKDITQKKNLETTLQMAYRLYENINEGIVITDQEGIIQNVNKAYCLITGYSPEELLGKNPKILRSNLHGPSFYQEIWDRLMENGSWEGEIWNRHKSGRLYLQKLRILEIRDERSKLIHYIGVSSDISEEEKLHKDTIRTAKLQRTLLPEALISESIEIDAIYAPSDYLSGDFYDYYWDQDQGILSGYIIDIMGHGLTAALQNSVLRVLFRQKLDNTSPLVDVLSMINRESMNYFLEDTFAAALCFRLDTKKKTLTYACAGINKFITRGSDGKMAIVKQSGPFLGIMEDSSFDEQTLPIENKESIYFLTDGLMDIFEMEEKGHATSNFREMMESLRTISARGLKDDASAIGIYIKTLGGSGY